MNKADLVDRIAGACEMTKTQATTAIDTAVDSITCCPQKGRPGSSDRVRNILCLAEKSPQRPQPANRRHDQDRGSQSREVHPWG